jgi:hypothetical protein
MTNVMDNSVGLICSLSTKRRAVTDDNGELRETIMRQRIIDALAYPRILVLANLDADECPQNLYFNPAHPTCRHCHQGEECRWLNRNDEFTMLSTKPIEALYESLLFCIDFVNAQSAYANHNTRRCDHESCQWVRQARKLAREYSQSIPAC